VRKQELLLAHALHHGADQHRARVALYLCRPPRRRLPLRHL